MVYNDILLGENISLRAVELSDCNENYLRWMSDPETNKYMETRWSRQSIDDIRNFVRGVRNSDHSYLFAIIHRDEHVGNVKVGPIHKIYRNADISYFIGEKSRWGMGVATEAVKLACDFAFGVLGLHRLQAGAFAENIGSQKVLEKNGFSVEAVFKEKYFLTCEENWTDVLQYVLFKDKHGEEDEICKVD